MKVIVLGGTIIGVCSAWYLAEQGHDVIVIERQSGAALETSVANVGQTSPGYPLPWAGLGNPVKVLGWLMDKLGPLRVKPASLCSSALKSGFVNY